MQNLGCLHVLSFVYGVLCYSDVSEHFEADRYTPTHPMKNILRSIYQTRLSLMSRVCSNNHRFVSFFVLLCVSFFLSFSPLSFPQSKWRLHMYLCTRSQGPKKTPQIPFQICCDLLYILRGFPEPMLLTQCPTMSSLRSLRSPFNTVKSDEKS